MYTFVTIKNYSFLLRTGKKSFFLLLLFIFTLLIPSDFYVYDNNDVDNKHLSELYPSLEAFNM